MQDKILYAFFSENYAQTLELCNSHSDSLFAQEFGALSAIKLGDWTKALGFLEKVYQHKQNAFWKLYLAKAYVYGTKDFAKAFAMFEELLENQEFFDEVALEAGFSYKCAGRTQEAGDLFRQLVERHPENLEFWANYAEVYFDNYPKESLEIHQKLCEVAKGMMKDLKDNPKSQREALSHSLELRLQRANENPQIDSINNYLNTKIYPQIAYLYLKLFRLDESSKLFHSLQEFNQNNAPFWQNFAKTLELTSDYQGAYEAYQKAIGIHPHATYYFDLAYLLMRIGEFDEGVKHYEARLYYAHGATFSSRHYTQSLDAFNKHGVDAFKHKKVVVFCEQGFGDTIMYARCLQKLCGIAKEVLFAPQTALYSLFDYSLKKFETTDFGNMRIQKDVPVKFDYAMPICSLPVFCGITKDEIPLLKTPILVPTKKTKKDSLKAKKPKVGLFWFTPKGDDSNLKRNFDLEFLIQAFKESEYELISFQVEGEEVKNLPSFIADKGKDFGTWFDTYKVLAEIDCMVSIDTAIAHLALAMEIPTILLLSRRFDWRWGRFENPSSLFWPNANIIVYKDREQALDELKTKTKEILQAKV